MEILGRPGRLPATGQCRLEVATDGPVELVAVNAAGRTTVRTDAVQVVALPVAPPFTAGPPPLLHADGEPLAPDDDVLDRLAARFLSTGGPGWPFDGRDADETVGGSGGLDAPAATVDDLEVMPLTAARGAVGSSRLDGLAPPGALPRPVAPQLPALDQPALLGRGCAVAHDPFRTATPSGPWPAVQEDPS